MSEHRQQAAVPFLMTGRPRSSQVTTGKPTLFSKGIQIPGNSRSWPHNPAFPQPLPFTGSSGCPPHATVTIEALGISKAWPHLRCGSKNTVAHKTAWRLSTIEQPKNLQLAGSREPQRVYPPQIPTQLQPRDTGLQCPQRPRGRKGASLSAHQLPRTALCPSRRRSSTHHRKELAPCLPQGRAL